MPSNNKPSWPQGGEIDIMEQVDGRNQQNVSTHYGTSPSTTKNTHLAVTLNNMSNTWHTYGLAFDSSHCAFYVDGKKIQTVQYPSGSPFAKDITNYGMILNLAMGGDWPKPAESSIGAQYLITDYVGQSSSVPSDF
jgi:beta-glucanase (GH16 family)